MTISAKKSKPGPAKAAAKKPAAAADAALFGNRAVVAAQLAPLYQAAQAIFGTSPAGAGPR